MQPEYILRNQEDRHKAEAGKQIYRTGEKHGFEKNSDRVSFCFQKRYANIVKTKIVALICELYLEITQIRMYNERKIQVIGCISRKGY